MDVIQLARTVHFPSFGEPQRKAISQELRTITLGLRDAYYASSPQTIEPFSTPFGGPIADSIGPWPEFILRGLPCQKSKEGCCTPCFYSRMPLVQRSKEVIYDSLLTQVSYILDNFEQLVRPNQLGSVSGLGNSPKDAGPPVAFVLTPTGSFFDESEFPSRVRIRALEALVDFSRKKGQSITLYIETHAEHVLSAQELGTSFDRVVGLLHELNGRVLLGFESSNEVVRNVLYNKYLSEDTFTTAVKRLKDLELGVGAFAFMGINPLTDIETISDSVATLDFLSGIDVTPVLMSHNIQPYTIQELLYTYRRHHLPEPRTILEIVNYMLSVFDPKSNQLIDQWLIADPVGGPPPPRHNSFEAKNKVTCQACSQAIHRGIVNLRINRNADEFRELHSKLQYCECNREFHNILDKQVGGTKRLLERTRGMVSFSREKFDDFCTVVRPIIDEIESKEVFKELVNKNHEGTHQTAEVLSLKAELICRGLRVEPTIKQELLKYNSYIQEAGFVHAAHFFVKGHLVNTCVAESFCAKSPYEVRKTNGSFQLYKGNDLVAGCELLITPSWCNEEVDGYKIGDIIRPHSGNVLSGMPESHCCFFENGTQCRFCSLGPLQKNRRIPAKVVAHAALRAFDSNNHYELNLSGGTSATPDRSSRYFREIAETVRKAARMPISIELVPPDDDVYLKELQEAGVSSVVMNIEIWSDHLRRTFCPGKSQIPIARYLKAIETAVSLFGRGQVASVLIAGLQSQECIVDGAQAIIEREAIPTIIPFKPFDDCQMSDFPTVSPAEVLEINRHVTELLDKKNLHPSMQSGCTGCGGCSLENLATEKGVAS